MSRKIKLSYLVIALSVFNLLFQYPFFKFVIENIDVSSTNGTLLVVSLFIASILANSLVFYIVLYLFRNVGKWLMVLFFTISAIAVFFINGYGAIIDESMIGNVLNTNYEEASSFMSFGLLVYFILLGIVPSFFLFRLKVDTVRLKWFLLHISLILVFLLGLVYANAANWLWIDKNSKVLGGLVMPWSPIINTARFYIHKNQENEHQILLPDANLKDDEKSLAVLVIGESARSSNFSLYGYQKDTNPLLSKVGNLHRYRAESCATYTTAGLKCILEHKDTGKLYEILPNYLFRNDVEVIWRTTNWGEPKVNIKNYLQRGELIKNCIGNDCEYDGVLLSGLKEQIVKCKKNKILVVLHTSTSHGPTYYSKYPERFKKFTPVCTSVELANCTQEELINAYDNTILYTDYLLASLIDQLKQLEGYKSTMMYVSDHGESLGENNLYMHGVPASIAPEEQLAIPFIIWVSDESSRLKENEALSQHHVFHSILGFLGVDSPIYDKDMNIFKE